MTISLTIQPHARNFPSLATVTLKAFPMGLTPDELGQKIKEAQGRSAPPVPGLKNPISEESNKALRMGTDFIISIVVGVFLGYWIDRWFGTKPFGIIIFLFLGFGAGVMNMQRLETGKTNKGRADRSKK